MRRLLSASLVAVVAALAACDPDLTIQTVPGTADGGASEGGTTPPAPPPASTDGGTTTDDGGTTTDAGDDAGPTGHVVDGVNDFAASEKLNTTSSGSGYYAYASWDAKNVYLGMEGADISAGTANPGSKWVHVYLGLDAVAGTTTGLKYNGVQEPTLPFAACYHLRWKVDGSYTNVQKWNGSAWVDAGVVGVPVLTVQRSGTFMEMSFSQASIGSPSKLRVHMNMLIEGMGNDWTYAGAPSTSFTDGKDPNFGKYFEFDPSSTATVPNAYTPKP